MRGIKGVFTSSDVIVVKTTAMREFTDPTGKQRRHSGNVYLHYLTNCLKGHDQKFQFSAIIVPDKTKVHLTDDQVAKWQTLDASLRACNIRLVTLICRT